MHLIQQYPDMECNNLTQTFVPSFSEQQCDHQPNNEYSASTVGDFCPRCRKAVLVYNGMLQVICPGCGYQAEGGAFT